ncbi:MAG: hypothetical protein MHM6MM_006265, partial [Cercozoa sp. M6MM]
MLAQSTHVEHFFGDTAQASPAADMLVRTEQVVLDTQQRLQRFEAALGMQHQPAFVGKTRGDLVSLKATAASADDSAVRLLLRLGDGSGFDRVLAVIAALCEESTSLQQHAEQHLLPQLSAFELREGEHGEVRMGTLLPLLSDAAAWSARVRSLLCNTCQQMGALMSPQQTLCEQYLRPAQAPLGALFDAVGGALRAV